MELGRIRHSDSELTNKNDWITFLNNIQMQLNPYISLLNVNIKQKLLTYDLIDRNKLVIWGACQRVDEKGKRKFWLQAWKLLEKRFPQKVATCSAEMEGGLSLSNKLLCACLLWTFCRTLERDTLLFKSKAFSLTSNVSCRWPSKTFLTIGRHSTSADRQ